MISRSLTLILEDAQKLGHLGPGPLSAHVAAARLMADEITDPSALIDVGTGCGVPGLLLCEFLPIERAVLLDVRQQRIDFVLRAIGRMGWRDKVEAVCLPVREAHRRADLLRGFSAVVARGFGPIEATLPALTPFARLGGQIVVSRASEHPEPSDALVTRLGLDVIRSRSESVGVYLRSA